MKTQNIKFIFDVRVKEVKLWEEWKGFSFYLVKLMMDLSILILFYDSVLLYIFCLFKTDVNVVFGVCYSC